MPDSSLLSALSHLLFPEFTTGSTAHKPVQEVLALANRSWLAGAACCVQYALCHPICTDVMTSLLPEGHFVCDMLFPMEPLHSKLSSAMAA